MDFLTLQAAKNYTDDTVEGMGIQKGKNCQIQNIEDITGGHRITFAWYDEDQVLQTDTVDIMDGPEGPEGPQGPQGEVGESGVGFGPVPEVMPEGVNWWVDPNGEPNTAATINDANVSEDETWSSKKIDSKFGSNNIWDGVEEAGIISTSTGEDEESTNGRRMPHDKGITVVPGDTYYIKKTTTAKIRYTFYGSDGTYIGNEDALGNTLVDTNIMSQKMIPPAGATQFRAFASSSMTSAGLTVPAGVGADIDEINTKLAEIGSYSTAEKVIGDWIDDKKIYQKTWVLTPSSATLAYGENNVSLEGLPSNIDVVLDKYCALESAGAWRFSRTQPTDFTSQSAQIRGNLVFDLTLVSATNGTCTIMFGQQYIYNTWTRIVITLKYTKKTT